jgi:hypothetical protein
VTALDTGISMNTFYGDPGLNSFVRKLFRAPYRDHFRYWILNIVEQNRHCQSFPKILSRYPYRTPLLDDKKGYGILERFLKGSLYHARI